jgi:hypothetical protein
MAGGSLGCPEASLLKKSGIFQFLFSNFSPTFLYSKKLSIKLLSTCIYIYLIYVEGSPQCGFFFFLQRVPQ